MEFTLFPKSTTSLSTTNQVIIKNVPETIANQLLKGSFRQVGLHWILQQAIIYQTDVEFFQDWSSTDSIHSLLSFMTNIVKCPTEAEDEKQQHQDYEKVAIS